MTAKKSKNSILSPRWRKVLADLWADKTRTILVVASIAVGVFAIGMVLTAFSILSEDIGLSYSSGNPANVEVLTDPFDDSLKRVIEVIPGVEDVEDRLSTAVRSRTVGREWQTIALVGIDDFSEINVSQFNLIEGSVFPNAGEILVSHSFVNSTGYEVGDLIEIELPDGSYDYLTVAGRVSDQTNSRPDPSTNPNAFATAATLRELGLGNHKNQLLITVEGSGTDDALIARVAEDVEDRIERYDLTVYKITESLSNKHPMYDNLIAIIGVLGALGVLITVLSSSLIINMLNSLLTQQLRQIGVMKLVGGRSSQILRMYLVLILVYSAITILVAVPLGSLAGYTLAELIAFLMGAVLQGRRLVPAAVIVQAVTAICVPVLAGFFPINRGARVNVRRAFSNYRPEASGSKRKKMLFSGGNFKWMPRPLLLSIRNTFRQKRRLVLTVFALTIAGSVFMAVFNTRASMEDMLATTQLHFMGDITLTFSRPYKARNVERILATGIPELSAVEGWGNAYADIWDEDDNVIGGISISAPPESTKLFELDVEEGRWLQPGDRNALVVSDTIYDDFPDLLPGDTLNLKLANNHAEDWEVVGIFSFVNIVGEPIAYANFDYVVKKTGMSEMATTFRINTDGYQATDVIGKIDAFLNERGFAVASIESGDSARESATSGIDTMIIFLLIMAVLAALVGSIGLTGTMSINVLERTREIGVMRTIGAVDMKIMFSVILEAMVIGLITWLLSIGLSFPISNALVTIIGSSIAGSAIPIVFNPMGVGVWLVVVVFLSIIASILPARKAARLTIREVLAYE